MEVKAALQAHAAAEREQRAIAARRDLEAEAVAAANLRKIRAQRVSRLKVCECLCVGLRCLDCRHAHLWKVIELVCITQGLSYIHS